MLASTVKAKLVSWFVFNNVKMYLVIYDCLLTFFFLPEIAHYQVLMACLMHMLCLGAMLGKAYAMQVLVLEACAMKSTSVIHST